MCSLYEAWHCWVGGNVCSGGVDREKINSRGDPQLTVLYRFGMAIVELADLISSTVYSDLALETFCTYVSPGQQWPTSIVVLLPRPLLPVVLDINLFLLASYLSLITKLFWGFIIPSLSSKKVSSFLRLHRHLVAVAHCRHTRRPRQRCLYVLEPACSLVVQLALLLPPPLPFLALSCPCEFALFCCLRRYFL